MNHFDVLQIHLSCFETCNKKAFIIIVIYKNGSEANSHYKGIKHKVLMKIYRSKFEMRIFRATTNKNSE